LFAAKSCPDGDSRCAVLATVRTGGGVPQGWPTPGVPGPGISQWCGLSHPNERPYRPRCPYVVVAVLSVWVRPPLVDVVVRLCRSGSGRRSSTWWSPVVSVWVGPPLVDVVVPVVLVWVGPPLVDVVVPVVLVWVGPAEGLPIEAPLRSAPVEPFAWIALVPVVGARLSSV